MKSGSLLLLLFLLLVFATCASQDESELIGTGDSPHVTSQEHYKLVKGRKLLDVLLKAKLTKLPDHQEYGKEEDHVGHACSDIVNSRPRKMSSEKSPKWDKHKAQRKKVMSRSRRFLKSAMDSLVMLNMDYNHRAHHRPPVNNGKPPTRKDDRS